MVINVNKFKKKFSKIKPQDQNHQETKKKTKNKHPCFSCTWALVEGPGTKSEIWWCTYNKNPEKHYMPITTKTGKKIIQPIPLRIAHKWQLVEEMNNCPENKIKNLQKTISKYKEQNAPSMQELKPDKFELLF